MKFSYIMGLSLKLKYIIVIFELVNYFLFDNITINKCLKLTFLMVAWIINHMLDEN